MLRKVTVNKSPSNHICGHISPSILIIAGSDNTAGAGIQVDLKTCHDLEVYATTVVTAVTAQNSHGVKRVSYVGNEMLKAQLDATLEVQAPDAVKIGMIPSLSAVEIIADYIIKYRLKNVVLDPVLKATTGDSLTDDSDSTATAMLKYLFPLATLVTPNIPEFTYLYNKSEKYSESDVNKFMECYRIKNLLLKGGHSSDYNVRSSDYNVHFVDNKCIDRLFQKSLITDFSSSRIDTVNSHGTGCVLSSAIAAYLAKGKSLTEAIGYAKQFITDKLKAAAKKNPANFAGPFL